VSVVAQSVDANPEARCVTSWHRTPQVARLLNCNLLLLFFMFAAVVLYVSPGKNSSLIL
jgi:hypothetical protein